MNMRLNGDWKNVTIGVLASLLVAGTTSWVAFGRDRVTRAEATELVAMVSPYVRDKPVIDELRVSVKELTVEVSKLKEQTTRLSTILERR